MACKQNQKEQIDFYWCKSIICFRFSLVAFEIDRMLFFPCAEKCDFSEDGGNLQKEQGKFWSKLN